MPKGYRIKGADKPCEPTPAIVLDLTDAVHVKIVVQRKADARLLAPKPQQACDVGLFSDDAAQLDLVDMARARR